MSFNEAFNDYSATKIRGDTVYIEATFTTLSGAADSYDYYFYGKLSPDDSDVAAVIKLDTVGGGIVITDLSTKKVTATIAPAMTATLVEKTVLFCEWQVKNKVSGDVQTVDGGRGKLIFLKDIVRST